MDQYSPLEIARFVPAITFRRSPCECMKVFFVKFFRNSNKFYERNVICSAVFEIE